MYQYRQRMFMSQGDENRSVSLSHSVKKENDVFLLFILYPDIFVLIEGEVD